MAQAATMAPDLKDFQSLNEEEQAKTLKQLKKNFKLNEIASRWDMTANQLNYLQKKLEKNTNVKIRPARKKYKTKKTEAKPKQELSHPAETMESLPEHLVPETFNESSFENAVEIFREALKRHEESQPKQNIVSMGDGLNMSYSGRFSPNDIQKKLKKLMMMIEDEDNLFDVRIEVYESDEKSEVSQDTSDEKKNLLNQH